MTAQLLNDIVNAFVAAIEAGTVTLGQYSFGLLAIAATLAFYFQVGPQVASGGTGVGDALAGFLLLAIKIGVIYWLVLHLPDLARAAFDTFAQWGASVSGGGFTRQNFVSPAEIGDYSEDTGQLSSCTCLMQSLQSLVTTFALGFSPHIECNACLDLLLGAYTVDTLLHLPVAPIATLHRVRGRGEQFVIEKRQSFLEGRRKEFLQRLTQMLEPVQATPQIGQLVEG